MKTLRTALILALASIALSACGYFIEETPPQALPGGPITPEEEAAEVPPTVTLSRFIVGPGDELKVSVWRNADLDTEARISPTGTISMPLIGELKVSGRDLPQICQDITSALRTYYVDPKVSVAVKSARGMKVYVLGEVEVPGVFEIDAPITALEAVAMAGGFTIDAKKSNVLLVRGALGEVTLRKLDMEAALTKGLFAENNTVVHRGDIIYVPVSTIANVDRFARRLFNILRPITEGERTILFGDEVTRVFQKEKTRFVVAP
jgi:protein involved in polysaccharide export with SLBB domain